MRERRQKKPAGLGMREIIDMSATRVWVIGLIAMVVLVVLGALMDEIFRQALEPNFKAEILLTGRAHPMEANKNFGEVFVYQDWPYWDGRIVVYATEGKPRDLGCPATYSVVDFVRKDPEPDVRNSGVYICIPPNLEAKSKGALIDSWLIGMQELGLNVVYHAFIE